MLARKRLDRAMTGEAATLSRLLLDLRIANRFGAVIR